MFHILNICTTFVFIILIAPNKQIRELALELQSIFAEMYRVLWLESTEDDPFGLRYEALLCWKWL